MGRNTFLKPPKKEEEVEEENEGLVPHNTLKIHPSTYDIKPHSPEEEVIMDELEGILGIEYDENFPSEAGEEEIDGHSYLHMNWEDEFSTTQFFQDAELWDCNADVTVKAERRCGYWDFDDKKASLNLSLNYQEVLEAWSNRGLLWAPSKSYMGEVPVMEEEQNGNWSRRQASVMRYKEKRQSRLFSKKIRYEVRKLNADKRPRIKGRFVKRLADKMQKGR
ncbi:hypothetical protein V2J09_018190 [Rumex salicifolius]